MTIRRIVGVALTLMCLGAVALVVEIVVSWPPDLPWELVRYSLVALYVWFLTWTVRAFIRQGRMSREEQL